MQTKIGFTGDGGSVTSAEIQPPLGVAVDNRGLASSPTSPTTESARCSPNQVVPRFAHDLAGPMFYRTGESGAVVIGIDTSPPQGVLGAAGAQVAVRHREAIVGEYPYNYRDRRQIGISVGHVDPDESRLGTDPRRGSLSRWRTQEGSG